MLEKPTLFKIIALIIWGLLMFVAITNQEMTLKDLSSTKHLPLRSSEYQFSQSGYAADDLIKYRVDSEDGDLLFGYSGVDEFTNILTHL